MHIKLTGSIPSKKNSRVGFVRNGRVMNIPNKAYKEWHDDAIYQLRAQGTLEANFEGVEAIITLYSKDNRRRDMDNQLGSIMDLLVDYGVLRDDSWQCVPRITVIHGGVDKVGGADIVIERM